MDKLREKGGAGRKQNGREKRREQCQRGRFKGALKARDAWGL